MDQKGLIIIDVEYRGCSVQMCTFNDMGTARQNSGSCRSSWFIFRGNFPPKPSPLRHWLEPAMLRGAANRFPPPDVGNTAPNLYLLVTGYLSILFIIRLGKSALFAAGVSFVCQFRGEKCNFFRFDSLSTSSNDRRSLR